MKTSFMLQHLSPLGNGSIFLHYADYLKFGSSLRHAKTVHVYIVQNMQPPHHKHKYQL